MAKKVLVVDDEKLIVKGIRFSLEQDGMEVDCAYDGEEALRLATENTYDMILLDIMLPKMDGFDVCQQIREFSTVPIVMLTAKGDDMDKILGLEYGADDYITKPFRVRELISRIKSIIRRYERSNNMGGSKLQIKDITVDFGAGKVYKEGREIILTALEYRLFLTFLNNRGQVLSRNQLLSGIWDVSGDYVNDNTLTVYIKRLREKLETDGDKLIETVRGRGYRLN